MSFPAILFFVSLAILVLVAIAYGLTELYMWSRLTPWEREMLAGAKRLMKTLKDIERGRK